MQISSKMPLLLICLLGCTMNACSQNRKAGASTKKTFKNVMIASAQPGDRLGPCEPTICVNPSNTQNIAAGAVLNFYYWSEDGGRSWSKDKIDFAFI